MTSSPLLLLLAGLISWAHSDTGEVSVTTKKGPIVGLRVQPNPATSISYDAFLGIPYGKVRARFQLAEARDPWTDPLRTQQDGPACPQPGMSFSEDCLYLNVFTPVGTSGSASKLAVIVFIHGSAFTVSSSSSLRYGPDFLVPANVILVTINYRLGAPGFLTLGSRVAPGNLGLHDSLLALRWVQDEISAFGGDPSQVALAGQSAGSVMTQMHYLSPLSPGLFARAIAHSGSVLARWALVSPAEGSRRARLLAQALGCNSRLNDSLLLDCLQKADINHVVGNQSIALPAEYLVIGSGMRFVPVLDSSLTADRPFFNDSLPGLMQQAAQRAKPLLTGFTPDDGSINLVLNGGWRAAQSHLSLFIPPQADSSSLRVSEINTRYFPNMPDLNRVQGLVRLYTDVMFAYPSVQMTKYFANMTYGYVFGYDGSWAPAQHNLSCYRQRWVSHGDDMSYLFFSRNSNQYLDTCTGNLANLQTMRNMTSWWTNFAKTGVPDPAWPTVSNGSYLYINTTTANVTSAWIEAQYYSFWASMTPGSNSAVSFSTISLFPMILYFLLFTNYLS